MSEGSVKGLEIDNTNITICSSTANSDKCANSCAIKPATFLRSLSQSSGLSFSVDIFSLILPFLLI